MSNKAQITQFMIMGIILVVAVGVFLLIKDQILPGNVVSAEFVPVAEYIKGCTEQKTEEAVRLIGIQGGYIEVPDYIRFEPFSYVSNAGAIIPYWYYDREDRKPTIDSMQNEISRYIEQNIQECTGEFEGFQDQYQITQTGNIEAETIISEEKIDVKITYPLSLKLTGQEQVEEITSLKTTTPIRLGRVYELAKEIMETENELTFLENNTMDMIAVADLPLEGIEIACGKDWSIQRDIKPLIQNIVKYNFHYLNFKNTKYERSNIEYFESFYEQEVGSQNNRDISVKTIYDEEYGMNVDVYPAKGDRVEGLEMDDLTDYIPCFNLYHHFYTIDYPVVFQLTDEKDPLNTYNFFFATPVIIEQNVARREKPVEIIDDSYNTITSDDYCTLADSEITVFAVDKITGQELTDVDVEYQCVNFNCELGTTAQPTFDGIPIAGALPKLVEKFPPCTNGFIITKKEGYLEGAIQKTIDETTNRQSATVEMTPLKQMGYSFIIKEGENTRLPRDDEEIYLVIDDKENDYRKTIYYPTDLEQFNKLELPIRDATYEIDAKLIADEQIVGGYEIEDWELTESDVQDANFLGITIFSKDPRPTNDQEYVDLFINEIEEESKNYRPRLE